MTGGSWLMIWVTSPVSLLAPPPGPLPLLMMTIFSVLDKRFADLAGDFGQDAHDHFDDGGLVVLLEGIGLEFHRLGGGGALGLDDGGLGQTARLVGVGFGQAGGFDDVGGGEALGLGGGGRAGGFGFQLELGGVGQGLDAVTLGVGRFLHVGFQFALFAQDFLLLQFDLLLLLDDADLDFLGLDQLAGLEFLQVVGQVGLRFLLIDSGLVTGHVGLIIALRLGDLGVGDEFGLLPGLGGLRGADHGVAVGLGLGDGRRRV